MYTFVCNLVVPTGIEPVTSSMSTKRSTTELRNYMLAGVTGFEPVFTISKTVALGQTKLYPNNKLTLC